MTHELGLRVMHLPMGGGGRALGGVGLVVVALVVLGVRSVGVAAVVVKVVVVMEFILSGRKKPMEFLAAEILRHCLVAPHQERL